MSKKIEKLEREVELAKELLELYKEIDRYKSKWNAPQIPYYPYPVYPDPYYKTISTTSSEVVGEK